MKEESSVKWVAHVRAVLSRHPRTYAFIVGVGIVLFWRGVWHSVDTLHMAIHYMHMSSTIDATEVVWWDGPVSLVFGFGILSLTGGFVSSFIGNELILSGLRGEKRLNEKTETQVKTEIGAIAEIKEELAVIAKKLDQL